MSGKTLRLSRFDILGTHRGIIFPIDHGLTMGPIHGLEGSTQIMGNLRHPAISGVIAHKGMIERLGSALVGKGVLVHLNGMSQLAQDPDTKVLLTSVEHALCLGADGVSIQLNYNGRNDNHNLSLLGSTVDAAMRFQLPVMTMVYDCAREAKTEVVRIRHLIRISIEMGADMVKIRLPLVLEWIPEILIDLSDDIRIYFAGGTICPEDDLLKAAVLALENGARGLCVGRNIFQRETSGEMLDQLWETFEPEVSPTGNRSGINLVQAVKRPVRGHKFSGGNAREGLIKMCRESEIGQNTGSENRPTALQR